MPEGGPRASWTGLVRDVRFAAVGAPSGTLLVLGNDLRPFHHPPALLGSLA
jgi:hypothetical protein